VKHIYIDSNKKGHYSPAVISNNMVYISGQLPIDYKSGKFVEGNIENQCLQVLKNIQLILKKVDLTINSIVQTRVYISDISYWDIVNEMYANFFKDHKPSRVIVPTRELHHGALIEIEAIAEMEIN